MLGFYRDQMAFTGMITSLDALQGAGPADRRPSSRMVRTQDGANVGATQDAVQKALAAYPTQKVMTKCEYLDTDQQDGRPDPDDVLRPAGHERPHLDLRHHQHPGAERPRADARDRHAARDRRHPAAAPPDGPLRERHHRRDRRGARHGGRHRHGLRDHHPVGRRRADLQPAVHAARGVPGARRGRRRDRGGAARRAAPPARGSSRPSSTSRPRARRRGGPAPSPWEPARPSQGPGRRQPPRPFSLSA